MARLIPAGGGGLPVGVPLHLPIATLPKNTVLLDGSPMPDWASAAVKAMYGATLPDYRGRTPVGTDEGSGRVAAAWAQTPGQGGGEEKHTLTESEMPAHNHAASSNSTGGHAHSGSTNSTGAHSHTQRALATTTMSGSTWPDFRDTTSTVQNAGTTTSAGNHSHSLSINSNGAHSHTISVGNKGGGQAANIMQPGISGKWVMKLK